MMRKCLFPVIIIFFCAVNLFSTPERIREIKDTLLGYINDEFVILQTVGDNKGSHYDGIFERYILIKSIEAHQLVLKQKIKITNESEITTFISNKNFQYAVSDNIEGKYFHLDENNKDALYYLGIYYNLKDILPNELRQYQIVRVEQVFDKASFVLVVLNMQSKSGIESLKKVILLDERTK